MTVIFFDTETTGNRETDRLCQLAAKERGVSEPIVNATYTPPVPISIESMAVHHITPKMIEGRPSFIEAPEYGKIKEIFESHGNVSVAHNASFDVGMLSREDIYPSSVICTYKVAVALDTEEKIDSYRLQYLRYYLGLEVEAVAHNAMGDVLVLEAIFERLYAKVREKHESDEVALKEMVEISSRPVLLSTFKFGKYNGMKIADVAKSDAGYLEWLLAQKKKTPESEADWIYTLEKHLGISNL
ncbi:MAG: exonuclease domain-containing protein [bacterium]|nr:exonuclease domain-containing protein [bacterium]